MADIRSNILECVGNTPIVRLNRIGSDLGHEFYVKLEFANPGNSIKDRIALKMVSDAEKAGKLKPGGTIIETTSGNTGMGLAMVAAVKGYSCLFVMPDKVSEEKIKSLRAFGARVVTCPTAVEPEDPRSYYSVAKRLATEVPNSIYTNQYDNPSNPAAHYEMTGPEIWKQMGEQLDWLVVATGTGGTISGTMRYLKEKNPNVKSLAVDPIGSIFYDYFKTGKAPKILTTYKVEGFGEDFIPGSIDFKMIDEMVQVTDQECFQWTRELVKKEGIFAGGSCGGAIAGALKFARNLPGKLRFLIILPDSGSRYLSKVYDDHWMRENGFLLEDTYGTVRDLIVDRYRKVVTAEKGSKVRAVVGMMKERSISQVPVVEKGKLLGLVTEVTLLNTLVKGKALGDLPVENFMDPSFKQISPDTSISELGKVFKEGHVAVVVEADLVVGIVTKIDYIEHLSLRMRT